MKILITGITGYIGSHLAHALVEEHQIFGLVRTPIHTGYLDDILDRITLLTYDGSGRSLLAHFSEHRFDLVYHLATYYTNSRSMEQAEQLVESNITFGARLLEAMAVGGSKNLIYTTSITEYQNGTLYYPLSLYAATKRAFADLMTYYAFAGYLRYGQLILSNTYGPRDARPKILNLIRKAAIEQRSIDLSDGTQDFPAVYIDDVVRALYLAGNQLLAGEWENRVWQIRPEETFSLRQVITKMVKLQQITPQLNWGARATSEREHQTEGKLFPTVPGWKAEVSLEDGLRRMTE